MSNRTPKTLRAREREDKRREKRAKIFVVASTPKPSWIKTSIVSMFTLLAGVPAFFSYFPQLALSQDGTVRERDAMGTVFNLTNNGPLPIFGVGQTCAVYIMGKNDRPMISGLRLTFKPLGYLGPFGGVKSLNCHHTVANMTDWVAHTSLTITIRYRPLFPPWEHSKEFPLEAEKADNGTWVWNSR
jgi:hypothetical protein